MTRRRSDISIYIGVLRTGFSNYRRARFAGQDQIFQPRLEGDAVVFRKGHVDSNVLIPPALGAVERNLIIDRLPTAKRHQHFGSMQSSQALAQSIFGTIAVLDRLSLLSAIAADDGNPPSDQTTQRHA